MTEITAYDDYSNSYESDSEFKYLVIGSVGKWKQGTIQQDLVFEENLPTGGISLQRFSEFARSAEYRIPIRNPIDLAPDTSCDIFFILDGDSKRLLLYDLNADYWEWIKCIRFTDPRAIAVGSEDLFVLDGNSMFVLAKSNFQVKRIIENIGIDPRAIALDNHQAHLYVYDADTTQKQLYLISYLSGRVTPLFTHGEGSQIGEVSAITIGKRDNNKLYLLDYRKRQVKIFSLKKDPIELEVVIPCDKPPQAVVAGIAAMDSENIFVGDKAKDVKYYYPHPKKYTASSSSSPPQPLDYSRQTHKIILNDKADVLYAINLTDNWIIKFVMEERFASNGNYISPVIDSGINALQWHKYVLECAIPEPENSFIDVSYFASDTEELPAEGQWVKTDLPNASDALMFDARGRYLRFKIQLSTKNHPRSTPVIWRIRAYLPRLSYLRYLPAVYQEDRRSREILERFLSLFETFFNQIDELSFTKYIDPKSTSDDFLPWLASWLALAYDENWPKANFRKLLEKAPYLYKMRGTRKGLEETIAIFLDSSNSSSSSSEIKRKKEIECPEDPSGYSSDKEEDEEHHQVLCPPWDYEYKFMIYESFQIDRKDVSEDYKRLFCSDPYTFCVLLNPHYVDAKKYKIIKKIIQDEKPAHTVGNTVLLQPWIYLGMHTYLGVNTVLQEPKFVVGKSTIGRDTQVTTSPNNSGQINMQARLGVDTTLS